MKESIGITYHQDGQFLFPLFLTDKSTRQLLCQTPPTDRGARLFHDLAVLLSRYAEGVSP